MGIIIEVCKNNQKVVTVSLRSNEIVFVDERERESFNSASAAQVRAYGTRL